MPPPPLEPRQQLEWAGHEPTDVIVSLRAGLAGDCVPVAVAAPLRAAVVEPGLLQGFQFARPAHASRPGA